jgi:hypothetical protein
MINWKIEIEWNKHTKKVKRRDQVGITRLSAGSTMATPSKTSKITMSNGITSLTLSLNAHNI